MQQNLYEILGVPPYSQTDEIKRAYKRLARIYHPDINREEGAEEIFKKITYAYSILSDPKKRFIYDSSYLGRGISDAVNTLLPIIKSLLNFNLRDAIKHIQDIIQNINTSSVDVFIEEGEIPNHTEKNILISRFEDCPHCYGYNRNCKLCMGRGKITRSKRITFRIPAYSFIKRKVRTDEFLDYVPFKKRLVFNVLIKEENISISDNGINFYLPFNREIEGKNYYVDIMGRLFEVNLPERMTANTILKLKRIIGESDINIYLKQGSRENKRCAG